MSTLESARSSMLSHHPLVLCRARLFLQLVVLTALPGIAAGQAQTTAMIEGHIRDGHGVPVVAASVRLIGADGSEIASTGSDNAGSYHLNAGQLGRGQLRVEAAGFESQAISVAVHGRQSLDVVLVAAPPAAQPAQSAEFFDQPTFTVAGVSDTSNMGGHGSNATAPARNAVSRDLSSLSRSKADASITASPEVQQRLTESVRKDPNNPELHHQLAVVDEELSLPLDAAREYQRAAEIEPSERNLFDWGADLLLHHAAQPAEEVFSRGSKAFPHSSRMLVGLGASQYVANSASDAWQTLCRAADLDPNAAEAYAVMGKLAEAESAVPSCAVDRLNRYQQAHPSDPLAAYYYALALRKSGEPSSRTSEHVQKLLRSAVARDPKLAGAYLQLGDVYSEQQNYEDAVEAFRAAEQADATLPEPHYRLSQLYRRNGRRSEADEELAAYQLASEQQRALAEEQQRAIPQLVYVLRAPADSATKR